MMVALVNVALLFQRRYYGQELQRVVAEKIFSPAANDIRKKALGEVLNTGQSVSYSKPYRHIRRGGSKTVTPMQIQRTQQHETAEIHLISYA